MRGFGAIAIPACLRPLFPMVPFLFAAGLSSTRRVNSWPLSALGTNSMLHDSSLSVRALWTANIRVIKGHGHLHMILEIVIIVAIVGASADIIYRMKARAEHVHENISAAVRWV